VYVPAAVKAVVATVNVLVPDEPGVRLTLVDEKVNVMPVAAGETDADRPTLPVKPRLLDVIVDVALLPAVKLAGDSGLADIVKSPTTVTVKVAVSDSAPLTPVTVTV
jgi:hypothetical protein